MHELWGGLSLVDGLLGVEMRWNKLTAQPALPTCWRSAEAGILYNDQPWRVTIKDGATSVAFDG